MEVNINIPKRVKDAYKKAFAKQIERLLAPENVGSTVADWLRNIKSELLYSFLGIDRHGWGRFSFERDSPTADKIKHLYKEAVDSILDSYKVEFTEKEKAAALKTYRTAFMEALLDEIYTRGRDDGRDHATTMTIAYVTDSTIPDEETE